MGSKFSVKEITDAIVEGAAKVLELGKGQADLQQPFSLVLHVSIFTGAVRFRQETVMGDRTTVSRVKNSVVNIKGTLHGASIAIDKAPVGSEKRDELQSLLDQLQPVLAKEAVSNPVSAEAISELVTDTMQKVAKKNPNRRSIEGSTKSMIEVAKDIAETLPIVTKMASVIAGLFGFNL